MNAPEPAPPLPAPLKGSDEGSFAHHTVSVRMPHIARRVLSENDLPPPAEEQMKRLINELPEEKVRALHPSNAPDLGAWQQYADRYPSHTWLDVPWFFAETYFYRRLLEATGFFSTSSPLDPFAYQKRQGFLESQADTADLAARLNETLKTSGWQEEAFVGLMHTSLWGNQADLSLWPAGEAAPHATGPGRAHDPLLIDDSTKASLHLSPFDKSPVRVDFLMDNAGFELVTDLCLIDYLVSSGRADVVHLHLKPHPTFVSDATIKDLHETIAMLSDSNDDAVGALGRRLSAHLEDNRMRLQDHYFWTSPLPGWEMPHALREELSNAHLIVSKGDANYRRLLGDRHWPHTTPFEDVACYVPAPLVALRTLKSEVAVGLSSEQVEKLNRQEESWLTSGRWGVIQFARPRPKRATGDGSGT